MFLALEVLVGPAANLTFSPLFSPLPPTQSYTGQTGGSGGGGGGTAGGSGPRDEDYEIPPITPPNHPEPPPLHLMEHDSTSYLCHSLPHNGLINPYSYPELPTLMMSNMLAQESHLVSNQMPSVSGRLMQRFRNERGGKKRRPTAQGRRPFPAETACNCLFVALSALTHG